MQRTNIYLEEGQTAALDRLAAEEGVSRAEIIRRLIDRALGSTDQHLVADLEAIEASFGALRDAQGDIDVQERGSGERERHLAATQRAES